MQEAARGDIMHKNTRVRLVSVIFLAAILISACTQSYSQSPLATATLIPTGLFVSPFPSGQDPLKIVADLGTQTAVAKTEEATTGTPGTPGTPVTATVGTAITSTGASPTLGTPVTAAATTPAPVTVVPGASYTPSPTITVPTGRPATYTLQSGEFPYCIARRFNVNPDDLLSLNGLARGDVYLPGITLRIPQSGSWPGDRALHHHPDTYTVSGAGDDTIYGVACYYGDVFPEAIAKANNLPLSASLSFGQRLVIP
jgi:LysM repeat protein